MKVPLKPQASQASDSGQSSIDDDIRRATAALELTTGADYRGMAVVLKAIHDTADDRGDQMERYVNDAKEFFREMKELAQ